MKAINVTKHTELAKNLEIAESLLSRMKGLLGKTALAEGEGLLIRPCKGIHTFGMKFPIDVIFLDSKNRVVAIAKNIPPNKATRVYLRASSVIELPAGTADSTLPGDLLEVF